MATTPKPAPPSTPTNPTPQQPSARIRIPIQHRQGRARRRRTEPVMNRRDLFKAVAGCAAAGAAGMSATPRPKYGRLDVSGHLAHRHLTGEYLYVYLDGVEVPNVYEADDVEGYALVFCADEKEHRDWTARGHKHLAAGGGNVCKMRLTGNVVIAAGPPPKRA